MPNSTFKPDYFQTAKELANAHRKADPSIQLVLLIPDPKEVEIKLVEVSKSAPTSGDVFPFRFDPRPDLNIHFASVVIILSPDEWNEVQNGQLALPPTWDLAIKKAI